jgi:hypothetical protein
VSKLQGNLLIGKPATTGLEHSEEKANTHGDRGIENAEAAAILSFLTSQPHNLRKISANPAG